MNLGIIGSGGFAKEVIEIAIENNISTQNKFENIHYIEYDDFIQSDVISGNKVKKISNINFKNTKITIAIANIEVRQKIYDDISKIAEFENIISKQSFVNKSSLISKGTIIMPFSYISHNVKIGLNSQINTHNVIGHDSILGDYFTSAHSVSIGGNNQIGNKCYFGMNSSTKQGITITNSVKFGLNSGVINNINVSGTYIGTPSKLHKN